ncbi:MAG: hypothetical protein O9301_02965 [Leptospira sp.]|nr:hypothetical protein [Leptospira sp.]
MKRQWLRISTFVFVVAVILLPGCQFIGINTGEEVDKRYLYLNSTCPFPYKRGVLYGNDLRPTEIAPIESLLNILLADICEGKLVRLTEIIDPIQGLYVDAKGFYAYEEVLQDLANPEGYFQTYYFDPQLLAKRKGTNSYLTVRQSLVSAGEIYADYYISSREEVEVRLRFSENTENAENLINSSFSKKKGKWYLLRIL